MSGPIQTLPSGLLGLLQLKQQGKNPSPLRDDVQSVTDLTQFWFQNQMRDVTLDFTGPHNTAVGPAANGSKAFATLQVPNGELWYVENFTVGANLLAAETVRYRLQFVDPVVGMQFALGADVNDVVTVRARSITASYGGFFLSSGRTPGLVVFDILTAATITFTVTGLRAVRLKL